MEGRRDKITESMQLHNKAIGLHSQAAILLTMMSATDGAMVGREYQNKVVSNLLKEYHRIQTQIEQLQNPKAISSLL